MQFTILPARIWPAIEVTVYLWLFLFAAVVLAALFGSPMAVWALPILLLAHRPARCLIARPIALDIADDTLRIYSGNDLLVTTDLLAQTRRSRRIIAIPLKAQAATRFGSFYRQGKSRFVLYRIYCKNLKELENYLEQRGVREAEFDFDHMLHDFLGSLDI